MRIVSWNIQCGRGVDGKVNLGRIARVIKEMGSADVICLQEVSRFNPDLDGNVCHDQLHGLAVEFQDYQPIFGAAVDRCHSQTGDRWQFGNAVLTNLPIIQTFCHQLPQPAPAEPVKHMPRQATEVIVETGGGPLRITTTHLEFHSMSQRMAQISRLRELFAEVVSNRFYRPDVPKDDPYSAKPRPAASILCGDFNAVPDDRDYCALVKPLAIATEQYHDAWRLVHGTQEHAPTCGVHDHAQWPQGAHCRDFFFVSSGLVESVGSIKVQDRTDASDHQPVAFVLEM